MCSQVNNTSTTRYMWSLLRHLLDPAGGKLQARQHLKRIFHQYPGIPDELKTISHLHTALTGNQPPLLSGQNNPDLDPLIKLAEIRAELYYLKTKSAAEPDHISFSMLRNVDDASIHALVDYLQECWACCSIPQELKCAKVVFIIKPGKPPTLANLRPVSIASCVGMLMERFIETRPLRYLGDNHLLADAMFGFRPHLAAPDIMLHRHQVVMSGTLDKKVIVGLVVAEVFDNVLHESILQKLQTLGDGHRTYAYVGDFLTDRKIQLSDGTAHSCRISPDNRGTPQGFVLSPVLFDVALIGIPKLLADTHNLRHSLYADDLTLWITEGSDGQIEEALQTAIDRLGRYHDTADLSCSATKSEYIIIPSLGLRHLRYFLRSTFRYKATQPLSQIASRFLAYTYRQMAARVFRSNASTSHRKRVALGITNTVSKLIKATITEQYERLSLTHAGLAILQQAGISPTRAARIYADLTPECRGSLHIPLVLKQMDLDDHAQEWLSGNAQVHTLARDLSCQAECRIDRVASSGASMSHDSLVTTYTGILQHYRLGR
ncbi:uncharacterized protein LOC119403537 [Rhipicephalus sanguineus]|uniref:uncharacterized protein LOC119403537 n=1 Tax=Rhipicephalus sanguineus TaxID=34632 RepID=UPI001894CD74|nr:uncharacterized protein LOC119403537 [Rhipicephalus sanguineus]